LIAHVSECLFVTVVADAGESCVPAIQRTAISTHHFSAILSAYTLPGWNGIDALHLLRDAGDSTPFLLVTGVLTEDAAAEFIQQGLDDYILKDRLARLSVALRRALEDKQLCNANSQVRSALEERESRAAGLIDHSIYGIFRVSLDGHFFSANPALLRILACVNLEELQ
jgi:DNA-binding NtrC family response regulator